MSLSSFQPEEKALILNGVYVWDSGPVRPPKVQVHPT